MALMAYTAYPRHNARGGKKDMADYLEIARRALAKYHEEHPPDNARPHFPHCPRCTSYALYRKNNVGNYEFETCGERDIPEAIAWRVQ
jgi:hypothetical protein